jgi:sterol 3beta-glucosyltransferase
MKILISTFGTQGDVQPFVALGKGLVAAGHGVTVCTPGGFRPLVEKHGLNFAPMNNDLLTLIQDALNPLRAGESKLSMMKRFGVAIRRGLDDEWAAVQASRPDLLLYHPKALGGYHIAEKLGLPEVVSLPIPLMTPTRALPLPLIPDPGLGGWFNRRTYLLGPLASALWSSVTNDFRVKTLGLAPLPRFTDLLVKQNGRSVPVLYSHSREVVPVPPDYPQHVHVTGYWFLNEAEGWQPSPELERFLGRTPSPIYVGFGSMGGANPQRRGAMVLEALRCTGLRAVVAKGWGAIETQDVSDNVFMLDSAPHEWLFSRVSAVVHHGGAGTTAAGLRAGKPTLICPFLGDQPFWGRVVHQLGVGPAPILQKKLTVARLTTALDSLAKDVAMQQRAAELGVRIRREDGIASAVTILEDLMRGTQ